MKDGSNTEETRRKIAWNSQTLYERADLAEGVSSFPEDQESRRDFLSSWEDATGHNRDVFNDVFQVQTEIEDDQKVSIRRALELETWPEKELPSWITDLEQLVTFATSRQPNLSQPSQEPFHHVIDTWVSFALNELWDRISPHKFSDDAFLSAASWLTDRLQEFCLKPLYIDFLTYGLMNNPSLFLGESRSDPDEDMPPVDTYHDFVHKLHTNDRLWSFFTEYPVLARFLTTTINQWLDSLTEFHRHLESDWDALIEHVDLPEKPQKIDELEILTDDRHHDGRSVIEVTVSEGETVIYKPRSVQGERVWYELVEHVFDKLQLDYDSPIIVQDGEDYGWVQKVPHTECVDHSEVSRFFKRTGVMLGMCYVLNFSDLHFENFVANGEYPVIVDAETLLQPSTISLHKDRELRREVEENILWTSYLPIKSLEGDDTVTVAGLESPPFDDYQRPGIKWVDVNTDRMTYEEGSDEANGCPKHLPVLSGEMQCPREYIREILIGFNSVVNILQRDGVSLIPPEIDSDLADLNQRLIFRDTMIYESILSKITNVESLEDGLELTTNCDKLLMNDPIEDNDIILDVYVSEFASLLRLDVPHFTIKSQDKLVDAADNCTNGLIDQTGYERVRRRQQHVQAPDLVKQAEYIQAALSPTIPPQRTVTEDLLRDNI